MAAPLAFPPERKAPKDPNGIEMVEVELRERKPLLDSKTAKAVSRDLCRLNLESYWAGNMSRHKVAIIAAASLVIIGSVVLAVLFSHRKS